MRHQWYYKILKKMEAKCRRWHSLSYFWCVQFIHQYPTWVWLRSIEYFVLNSRQSLNLRFTIQFILETSKFILSKNSMTFYEIFPFANTRDGNGCKFCPELSYIINELPWNRAICYHQKQVSSCGIYMITEKDSLKKLSWKN